MRARGAYGPVLIACLSFALFGSTGPARAAPLTPGSLLVTTQHESSLLEYTREGELLQTIAVPYPAGERPDTERTRDILSTGIREVLVYNGTFTPFLSIYDAAGSTWSHLAHAGWSTTNNVSYGGIAELGDFVYVTSLRCCGEPSGIVRFDRSDSSSATFHGDLQFIDLTIGQDGLLYGLHHSERSVSVFDPGTMERVRFVPLAEPGNRGIAVDEAGHIFAASEDGLLYHFDSSGALLGSVLSGAGFLTDLDLSSSGELAAGARSAAVVLANKELTALRSFSVGTTEFPQGAFVSFVEPDPNRPPDCSHVAATPSLLATAKHIFAPVTLTAATDPDGDGVSISIVAVTQDEPVSGKHSGKLAPDATRTSAPDEVLLRRERDEQGDGRVYRIAFTASDGKGGACDGTVTVGVARKGGEPVMDSAPPEYDSFGA